MNTTLPACLHFVSWLCATVVSVLCYLFHNQQEITDGSTRHPRLTLLQPLSSGGGARGMQGSEQL